LINVLIWLFFFIPALVVEIACYLLAPVVALFVTRSPRYDVVKRLGKAKVLLERDNLIRPLILFQTHDNAVDEWWYGVYNTDHWFKFARDWQQYDYNNSAFIRYYCRVMWLWRNCAYGWLYLLFSRPKEFSGRITSRGNQNSGFWYELKRFPKSFQLESHIPLGFNKRYLSINIGFKSHKLTERLLYANRIIGFRKYKS
jgi:hypothetical protein